VTLRRCRQGHFYDKKLHACPECGVEAYGFNKHLRTAILNNGLFAQAERAEKQKGR
jgi:hypothetical protein